MLLALVNMSTVLYGQTADTVANSSTQRASWSPNISNSFTGSMSSVGAQQKIFVQERNIVFASYNPEPSAIENEIVKLESRESVALKERNAVVLKELWARDFSLDKNQNELVEGPSALPNYMSVARMIDRVTVIDNNTVSTSGTEYTQEVKDGKVITSERKFFHTWMRGIGGWKLTTKG